MSTTEQATPITTLTCIREGEIESIKLGQAFEVLSEDDRNWEIEADGERHLVSKTTSQIRGCWDSPWLHLMPPPVVAWLARDDYGSVIMFGPHTPTNQQVMDATHYEIQNASIERAPEFDQYAETGKVPASTLLELGHFVACHYCGRQLPRNPEDVFGPLLPLVVEGDRAWCDAKCRGQAAANRATRKADAEESAQNHADELLSSMDAAIRTGLTGAPHEISRIRELRSLATWAEDAYKEAAILAVMDTIFGDDYDYLLRDHLEFVCAKPGEGKPGDTWFCVNDHQWLCRVDDAGVVTLVEYQCFTSNESFKAATLAVAPECKCR